MHAADPAAGPNPIRAARRTAGAASHGRTRAGDRQRKEEQHMIVADQKPIEEIIEHVKDVRQRARPGLQRVRDRLRGRREEGGGGARLGAAHALPPAGPGGQHRRADPRAPVRPRVPGGDPGHHRPVRCGASPSPAGWASSSWPRSTRPRRSSRGQHLLHGGDDGARGVWTERCQGCGQCILAVYRRDLPGLPLRQAALQRPLRRLHGRQVRDQQGRRLRLAADHRPAQGARADWRTTRSSPRSRTGPPTGPAARERSSGRICRS